MALAAYQTQTQTLLQLPGASPQTLYPLSNITTWINTARGQLAGEGECIRLITTLNTVIGQRNYNFSALDGFSPSLTGIKGVLNVRRITYSLASGQQWIPPRAWEWFDLYHMNNPVPQPGPPVVWSQYAQGAQGSFYIDPPPDAVYRLNCDCVMLPIDLVDDTMVEAIPFPWTDSIPFFAGYYALLSSQTAARQADAERLFGHYQTFMGRARQFSNPSVNRPSYEQAGDPAQANKYGLQQAKGAA